MRRLAVSVVFIGLMTTSLLAIAQDDPFTEIASLGQLQKVTDGFVAGTEIDGVVFPSDTGAGSPIVSQFQIATNLVGSPTFGEEGIEFIPTGFVEGSSTELADLSTHFDGPIDEHDLVPPLAPNSRDDESGIDVSAIFEGWDVYGERGPIEDPWRVLATVYAVWGVSLADPLDPTCPEPRFVGRSWVSESFAGADPLFTADGLDETYRGTHQALVGSGGRLVELACLSGGPPVVIARRMSDEGGLSTFGPTSTVVLVKDSFVVFLLPINELDGQLHQFFYASPVDGGPVVVSEVDSRPLLLLPNPYETYDTRISIRADLEEPEAMGGRQINALYREDRPGGLRIQSPDSPDVCPPTDGEVFIEELLEAGAESEFSAFSRDRSIRLGAHLSGNKLTISGQEANGEVGGIAVIDVTDGTVLIRTPACEGTGHALVNGEPIGVPDEGGGAPPADDTTDGPPTEGADDVTSGSEGSGLWGPIGVALVLLAAAVSYGVYRSRARNKNCEPERQAYAAAKAAYDKAKNAKDYWGAEYEAAQREYNERRIKLDNRLREPDRVRGYPEGPNGDKAYADDLSHWQAQEAEAATIEKNLAGFKQALDEAKAERDKADAAERAAWDVENQARMALDACTGSTTTAPDSGETPSGTPTPIPPPGPSVIDEPDETDKSECKPDGATEIRSEPGLPSSQFTILSGSISLPATGPLASWNNAFGGPNGTLGAEDVLRLSDSDVESALSDYEKIDNMATTKFGVTAKIPTSTYKVSCGRVWRCQGGKWVKTSETARMADELIAEEVETVSGHGASSMRNQITENLKMAQTRVEVLMANEARMDAFGCD